MSSDLYTLFPAVNADYEFPPEVRTAFLASTDVQAAIDGRADAKALARTQAVTDVRQYQNYRWTNSAARDAQTGMRYLDRGIQIDTSVEYQYDGSQWQKYIAQAEPSNNASNLTVGTLSSARFPYEAMLGYRGDRSVDAPVSGDVIDGDWNLVLQPNVYRTQSGKNNTNAPANAYLYGTLVVFGAGGSIQSRTQVYCEHGGNGYVYTRTAWNGTDWNNWQRVAQASELDSRFGSYYNRTDIDNRFGTYYNKSDIDSRFSNYQNAQIIDTAFGQRDARLNALELSVVPGFGVAAGWTVNRATFWRAGRVVTMDLSLKRTGGSIASGNVQNVKMGDVSGGFGTNSYVALSSGPGGTVSSFYIQGTAVFLAATTASIANNAEVTCGGTWIMS